MTILTLSIAAGIGWPSPTLPKLLAEDSPIPITPDQSSSIVSISVVGTITGPIPNSFLINRLLVLYMASVNSAIIIRIFHFPLYTELAGNLQFY